MAFVINYPPVETGVAPPQPPPPPDPPPDIPGATAGGSARLKALFDAYGMTSAAVAVALGLKPELFDRIAADRQPMPLDVAAGVATVLGTDVWEVVASVSRVTPLTGPIHRRPVPARPALGDLVPPAIYQPTQTVSI